MDTKFGLQTRTCMSGDVISYPCPGKPIEKGETWEGNADEVAPC